MKHLLAIFRRLPEPLRWACCLVLVAVIGVLDHASGYELSMSIFYLIPISLAAWEIGRPAALLLALVSATVWLVSDLAAGNVYSAPWIPFWNGAVRLGFFLVVAGLLTRLRAELHAERLRADHDGLTGLLNPAAFLGQAQHLMDLLGRQGRGGALGMLDLDDFKSVNDTHGHAAGDRLLVAVAGCLGRLRRSGDLVGRLGGDEFAILLVDTDEAGARAAAARLASDLARVARGGGWPVGFSGGLMVFDGQASAAAVLAAADAALYAAKRSGKGQIQVVRCNGAGETGVGLTGDRPATD